MNSFATELAALKAAIDQAGIPVDDVLHHAGVDRSTWTRWNNGSASPRFESWAKVKGAAEHCLARKRRGAAA